MINQRQPIDEFLTSSAFRKRPAMYYLGENSLSKLEGFLVGVLHTTYNYCIDEEWPLHDFNEWIAKYFDWSESTAGWKNIILHENSGGEEKALKHFICSMKRFD